jgi:hypothetical protein
LVRVMKIRLSELRRIVREALSTPVGWPTDEVEHVYGVPDRMADMHPTELGNLRLPKGPNSRDTAEDRPLDDMVPPTKKGYGAARGVGTNNKSGNDAGRGGGGGG